MWLLSRKGVSGFSSSSTAEDVTRGIDGTGLTAIVTGASSGIGAETARVLALRGVHVIMGVIDMIGAENVKEAILKEIPTAKVDVMELDLSSMASVRNFASKFNSSDLPLNILINNAGIFGTPFTLSKDNIELQFAINYVGHFLLTNLLLGTMMKTTQESKKQGRIVNVSSVAHRSTYDERILFKKINDQSSYNAWLAYGQSKLANILHANELARRLKSRVERENQRMWPFSRKGGSGFSSSSTAEDVTHGIDGTGLTAIVTGASSGIGAETARVLALRGVRVIMGVIDMIGAKNVKEAILKEIPIAKVDIMELDLSSMESIRKFASKFNSSGLQLNILINNAGILATPFTLSKDNIELQFAINYLGHFLLTNLLLDTMKKTTRESKKQGRIVNVSSVGHRLTYREGILFEKINDKSSYNAWLAYGQSKLANILHANELARRLKEDGIDIIVNSLHPGLVATNIYIHSRLLTGIFKMLGPFLVDKITGFVGKNVRQGASTTCYLALHPQVSGISGKYFVDNNLADAHSHRKDIDLAKKLWDYSINLT
ncbi:Short-chain dehydrogenase TIC 32, chloroplastic, partial [Mucuna pruriens]